MNRRSKILDHDAEVALQRCPAADNDIVVRQRHHIGMLDHFAKPAANAISFGRSTDLLADSKTNAREAGVVAQTRLHDKGRPANTRALSGGEKIRAFFQPVHDVNRRIGVAG